MYVYLRIITRNFIKICTFQPQNGYRFFFSFCEANYLRTTLFLFFDVTTSIKHLNNRLLRAGNFVYWSGKRVVNMRSGSLLRNVQRRACLHAVHLFFSHAMNAGKVYGPTESLRNGGGLGSTSLSLRDQRNCGIGRQEPGRANREA